MNTKPILFSGEMVRAIMEGRKTQTRRIIKGVGDDNWLRGASNHVVHATDHCPHGQPGDLLWVREGLKDNGHSIVYRIDGCLVPEIKRGFKRGSTRSPLFMPRYVSRITLEITDIRVERLQDINRGDCMAEGCPFPNIAKETDPVKWFSDLWESINGPDSWDKNPWVWVIEFKPIIKNVDQVLAEAA